MKGALMNCYWSTVAVHLCMWLQRHRSLGAKNERSMEKGTRKKQRRYRSHWKNTSMHTCLSHLIAPLLKSFILASAIPTTVG